MDLLTFLGGIRVGLLILTWTNRYINRRFNHNEFIEFSYTAFPVIVLSIIGYVSVKLLYLSEDNILGFDLTVKIIGHQWYWSYEFSDLKALNFDSYLLLDSLSFYMLDTDIHLILPEETRIRFILGSDDVIHAWAIPSLGIKVDVVPGRLNTAYFYTGLLGIYFGQCSEICGANHSLIRTTIEVIPIDEYLGWILVDLDESTLDNEWLKYKKY